ncbi:AAA family ATPase [Oceanospirillum sediminis]|uniref:AAA family ATPase n=1 Tax=Oceanospirillum sediminis TaxID=2760088 RepID=A0A839ISK7_9GAMM|nr:AAA family ATPase [Oceanospirillum sediminis]MBB1487931.1 AAA family ATPase [Oceanospirillum sediminis]
MSGDNFSFSPITPSVTDGVIEESLFFPAQQQHQVIELITHLCRYSNLMLTITGPQGAGKTLVKRRILDGLDSGVQICDLNTDTVTQPQAFLGVLSSVLNLGLPTGADLNQYLTRLKDSFALMHREGQACLIVIDDAQKLSSETLELLLILLSDDDELCRPHVLMLGENQLLDTLNSSRLKDRFIAIGHHLALEPMNTSEARNYLDYRLEAANVAGMLSDDQKTDILRSGGGVPGQINRMANLALSDPDSLKKVAGITAQTASTAYSQTAAPDFEIPLSTADIDDEPEGLAAEPKTKKRKSAKKKASSPARIPVWHLAALSVVSALLIIAFLYQDDLINAGQEAPAEVAENTPLTDLNRLDRPADETLAEAESLQETEDGEAITIIKPVFPQEDDRTEEEKRQADASLLESVNTSSTASANIPEPTSAKPVEAKPEPAEQKSVVVAESEPEKPASATTTSKSNSPYKQEDALLKLNKNQYTLQLLGTQIENNAIKFIGGLNSKKNVRYFETVYKGKPWFVVIYGEYQDRDSAIASIPKLAAELQARKPWARSIASVQADIRKK